MSTHRHIDAVCIIAVILVLAITILFMNGEAFGLQVIVDEDAENFQGAVYFTENDRKSDWNSSAATKIMLRGDYASVSGGGAYAYDGNVVITSAGKYTVSGTLDDGSIIVETDGSAKVWIQLNNAEISCSSGACLDIEQADKVFLTLADGTENILTETGFSAENEEAGMDGALFSRDDLTINGNGSLQVTAAAEHGIVCNDELVITGGKISVTAAADALHANDAMRITGANLDLHAGDDGIAVTGMESELYIESGTINIFAADKGIAAENTITFAGGEITVESTDDGISAVGDVLLQDGRLIISSGDDGIHSDHAVMIAGGTIEIPTCYEGIEALKIDVSGGDITICPEDDGMNANGNTGISFGGGGGQPGGGMNGGKPGQRDGNMEPPEAPADGTWSEMPERMEPPVMPTGEFQGIPERMERPSGFGEPGSKSESANDRERSEAPEGMELPTVPGNPDTTASVDAAETWIHISGGSITVINDSARDADGLDSNGDIIISGGTIHVSLVNSGSNSALDYGSESGGVMEISGGEVIACGSYGMAEGFDASSTQCAILYNIKRGVAAGTKIMLEDAEGNVLLSYEAPCSFSSVALSCPEMQLGESYTVVIGDSAEEISLEEVSASFGDAQSEGFGGQMNWGGMKFRPGM